MRFILLSLLAASTAFSEQILTEVKGVHGKLGKSTVAQISVLLVDVGRDLLTCTVSVEESFGPVEQSVLFLADTNRKLAEVFMHRQTGFGMTPTYEFHVPKDLLQHSTVHLTQRDGDDLKVYRVLLATFDVIERKKGKS